MKDKIRQRITSYLQEKATSTGGRLTRDLAMEGLGLPSEILITLKAMEEGGEVSAYRGPSGHYEFRLTNT